MWKFLVFTKLPVAGERLGLVLDGLDSN